MIPEDLPADQNSHNRWFRH